MNATEPSLPAIESADDAWMRRALELAERGRGWVEPNPLVGAVVVRDGRAVGEGWHQRYGEAHAEVNALAVAGEAARGATVYVTLEPCCHHGKTPPCTDAILRAGVRRVVAATTDPFPQVAGRGLRRLREAGVEVTTGVGEAAARRQNAPYLTLLREGRPYVHAKWAMTLDGKIATATGHSQWISGPESRRCVHELRGRVDAILVGRGTVVADDPQLTARPPGPRAAVRIVLTRTGALPVGCHLLRTARAVPVLIATAPDLPADRRIDLEAHGCEVLAVPDVAGLLAELGRRRLTNLLVEGGAGVLGSFLDADQIDAVHVFVAARLIGGQGALSPVGGVGVSTVERGPILADWQVERLGDDVRIHGRVARPQADGQA